MNYLSGEEILVGDSVFIENGKTPGIIERIIETQEEMKQCNVEEAGVLIKSPPFGLVFWPQSFTQDPVIFKQREST